MWLTYTTMFWIWIAIVTERTVQNLEPTTSAKSVHAGEVVWIVPQKILAPTCRHNTWSNRLTVLQLAGPYSQHRGGGSDHAPLAVRVI